MLIPGRFAVSNIMMITGTVTLSLRHYLLGQPELWSLSLAGRRGAGQEDQGRDPAEAARTALAQGRGRLVVPTHGRSGHQARLALRRIPLLRVAFDRDAGDQALGAVGVAVVVLVEQAIGGCLAPGRGNQPGR